MHDKYMQKVVEIIPDFTGYSWSKEFLKIHVLGVHKDISSKEDIFLRCMCDNKLMFVEAIRLLSKINILYNFRNAERKLDL